MMSEKNESKEALRATGIIGGGQVFNILIGMIRTKFVAIILGPSGVGIVGLLTTATNVIQNVSSFGLTVSGVRDISIANNKNDDQELAKTVRIFNQWVLLSALLGAVIAIVFSAPLSLYLFDNYSYTLGIAVLSSAIFFTTLGAGLSTVMQGKRAIGLMVKSSIISNLIGSAIMVSLYFIFGTNGIIPSLILSPLIIFAVNFLFYKKLKISFTASVPFLESWSTAKGMLKLGLLTVIGSVFDQVMSLVLRAFISKKAGVDGVGLFTAANSIAAIYLTVVLAAIASEYYPKLAAINEDNALLNKSVNNQLNILLLLASPIIIGMVGFADIAILLLYSDKFIVAVDILKWQILGDFFKIISWVCTLVFLAKGMGKLYVGIGIVYSSLYTGIVFLGWDILGFLGIGVAFFIVQIFMLIFTYAYSSWKFNITIASKNYKTIAVFAVILIISFLSHEYLGIYLKRIISAVALLFSIAYSIYNLNSFVDIKGFISNKIKRK